LAQCESDKFGIVVSVNSGSNKKILLSPKAWLVLISAYVLLLTLISTLNFPPQTFSDSASFRSGEGVSNFNWVSFSGATHGRGWPIILIYSILNTDKERVLFQTTLYFLSIALVANGLFRLRNKDAKYLFFAIGFLLIGTLKPLLMWNNYISRESLSLTLVILCVGQVILSKSVEDRNRSSLLFIANSITATLAIIVKPIMIPFILLLMFYHLYFYNSNYRNRFVSKVRFISVMLISLFMISYGFWNSSNQNIGWSKADPTGRTLQEISYSYVISDFNYNSIEFLSYLQNSNVSTCFVPNEPLDTSIELGLPMETAAKFRQECPTFSDWVKDEYLTNYLKYRLADPITSVMTVLKSFPGAFALLGDGRAHSLVSDWLGNLLLFNIFSISKFSFIIIFCLNLMLCFLSMRIPNGLKRKRLSLNCLSPILLFYSLLLSVVTSALLQPTHVADLSRQNYSANILMRLIVVWQVLDLIFNQKVLKFLPARGININER